jgi:hypothetical protein
MDSAFQALEAEQAALIKRFRDALETERQKLTAERRALDADRKAMQCEKERWSVEMEKEKAARMRELVEQQDKFAAKVSA